MYTQRDTHTDTPHKLSSFRNYIQHLIFYNRNARERRGDGCLNVLNLFVGLGMACSPACAFSLIVADSRNWTAAECIHHLAPPKDFKKDLYSLIMFTC